MAGAGVDAVSGTSALPNVPAATWEPPERLLEHLECDYCGAQAESVYLASWSNSVSRVRVVGVAFACAKHGPGGGRKIPLTDLLRNWSAWGRALAETHEAHLILLIERLQQAGGSE